VRGCLNKIPKLRPTYAMLLQHGWLAPLCKPAPDVKSGTDDPEVAAWVRASIERRRSGLVGESRKPALHAAPLDTVSPAVSPG